MRAYLACALVPVLLALAGCQGNSAGLGTGKAFATCAEVDCSGVIDGAAFEIVMPSTWNGTLLLYSHGYRSAQPVPPDFAPVSTVPEPAPGWSSGNRALGESLLQKGYALAGSAYSSNGWAVADAVLANEQLVAYFTDNLGSPRRILAWGDSLGGLITVELAQRHDWVSGALPMCGVVAGVNPNFDLGLDLATIVRALIAPELPLTNFGSYEDTMSDFQKVAERIAQAAQPDRPQDNLRLLLAAALVGAPRQTQSQDGVTAGSAVQASAEAILTGLAFGTVARQELQGRVGGNPSSTEAADYRARLDAASRARLVTLAAELGLADGDALIDRWLTTVDDAERTSADPQARQAAEALGAPTGVLRQPTLVLHTAADPVVIAQNTLIFSDRVRQSGAQDLLRTVIIEPPPSYDTDPGAAYGAGHCRFTDSQRATAVDALDQWVASGKPPDADQLRVSLGPGAVIDPDLPPWPGT